MIVASLKVQFRWWINHGGWSHEFIKKVVCAIEVSRLHVWLADSTHVKMETHGCSRRFRFPGYNGALPKALRSLRGRSKYEQKISKPPSDWGFFELLATVAGQVLQENDLNEEKAKKHTGIPKNRENTTTDSEGVSETDHGFVQHRQSDIAIKPTDCGYKSKDVVSGVEITSKAIEKTVKNNNIEEEVGSGGVYVGETLSDPCTDMPCVGSRKGFNIVVTSEKGSNTVDNGLACRLLEGRYNGPERTVSSDLLAQSNLDVLVGSKNQAGNERLVYGEGSCVSMRPLSPDKSPVPSYGSMEEDLTSVHTEPLVLKGEKNTNLEKHSDITRQKLVCVTAKDDDDNSSVLLTGKATSPPQISSQKEFLKEELQHGQVRMETSAKGCKRKCFPNIGTDSSVGSSPSRSTKAPWRKAKTRQQESHVKVNITSFKVPELCIDLPKTATVANLKRAVMDAAINVLGGGLHVRVLHQGKKVHDESTTLVQMGVSNSKRLDSLAFMLEPDLLANTSIMQTKDPLLGLPNASNESATWYPVFSFSKDGCENKKRTTMKGEPCGYVVTDVAHNIATQRETNLAMEPGRGVEHDQYNPSEVPVPLCRPLILHPSSEIMDIVMAQHSFQGTNYGKRRVRRPFTVLEVTALVQAVELLGTGRWREIKQQAFDHARHRTYVDLKDKWKTLVHTAHIAPHQRRGEPVPQDLLDRVLKAHSYWAVQHAKTVSNPG